MSFEMEHRHPPGYLREVCEKIHHAGHSSWQGKTGTAVEHLEAAQQLIDDWIECLREEYSQ